MKKERSIADKCREIIKRWLRRGHPEHPDDPYALVGAPKKPRPPFRSAAAAVRPDSDS